MAVKLIVLYTQPENPTEFDEKYFNSHLPLAEKMPGLRSCSVSKIAKNLMGKENPYYMIAELVFDDMDALNAALKSAEGQAAGANIMGFAGQYITMLTAEVVEKSPVSV